MYLSSQLNFVSGSSNVNVKFVIKYFIIFATVAMTTEIVSATVAMITDIESAIVNMITEIVSFFPFHSTHCYGDRFLRHNTNTTVFMAKKLDMIKIMSDARVVPENKSMHAV